MSENSQQVGDALQALVIEPTRLYQGILSKLLKDMGFEVVIKQNGHDGLEQIKTHSFDLICMSMQLPDIDGIQLCSQVRADKDNMKTAVIMITANEEKENFQQALISGATEVFYKNELSELSIYLEYFVQSGGSETSKPGRILYIEDQKSLAMKTMALLEEHGYQVTHFTNVDEALCELQEAEYDLVLTDLMLEGKKSGFTLVREIKQLSGRYTDIPILAISGLSDVHRKIELLNSGVSDYIQKPVVDEELLARVQNLVRMRHLLDKVEAQRAEMRELAMLDQLTKLYNRHYLMDVGPKKISESIRHKIDMSLLVIDLDHFKYINDTHGHDTGDTVLVEVATVLHSLCRNEDIAARFGGEEFIMILNHCNEANAINKAETIREHIEALDIDGIKITASIGVASLPENLDCDFSALFKAADTAVYKAKDSGRNRVTLAAVTH